MPPGIPPAPVPQQPPAPVAPEMPGGPMPPAGGDQMATDEQKQQLLDMINQIRMKLGSFNAQKFAAGNKTDSMRRALLKQVFEKLQMAGVDLTDQQSVSAFMDELRQSNPEIADMFEKAMDALLGPGNEFDSVPQDPTASIDLGVPPQNNMNNPNPDETLPKGV